MKREFITFVRKSRINLMLTLAALSMLLVSVMSVTYCWIEGSTFLLIKGDSTISDTNKEIVIDTNASNTIELNPYIDNADNLFLAPAKSADGKTIQILNGSTYRTATVNDIGNNYIAFDVKVNCGDTAKIFTFSDDSAISVNNAPTDAIKLSVDVDNTVEDVFSGNDLAGKGFGTIAGEHILTFRIWYDNESGIDLAGKTVDFNIVLNATLDDAGYANVTFVDNTLNSSKLYLTKDLEKMTLTYTAYGGSTKTREMTYVESNGIRTYTLNDVPANATNLIFKGYDVVDTTETLTAKWDAGSMPSVESPVYTAYGSTFATSGGTGTWGNVIKINLNDLSYDQIYKKAGNVSLTNSGKSITDNMYNDVDNHFYTYLAAGDFTLEDTFTFKAGTNSYYSLVALSELNDLTGVTELTYSIYGKTATIDTNGTLCYGIFCDKADFITFRDATTNGDVPSSLSIMVSAGGGTPYYATYSSSDKVWYMYVPTDINELTFTAFDGATQKYTWNGSNRVKTGNNYIYSATAVATSGNSEGTWTAVLACSPEILKGTKVSFYGGVDSSWNDIQGMYIANMETTSASDLIQSYSNAECFDVDIRGDRKYRTASFVDVTSADYYLKHQTTWAGKQLGENAVGGKFYGVYTTDNGTTNLIKTVDATTGATTIASSVPVGTATMNVSTTLSSLKTAANTDMYVQYYVNDELVSTSSVVSSVNYAATIDISKYTATPTDEVTVKTVLTDGTVFYVADTDKFKVASNDVTTIYVSTTYNGLYIWSPKLMGEFSTTEKNLTNYDKTTIDNVSYYVVQFNNSAFEGNTTFNMIVRIGSEQSKDLNGADGKGYTVGKTYIVKGTTVSNVTVSEYTGGSGGGGETVTNLDYYIGGRFTVYTSSDRTTPKSTGEWSVKNATTDLKMTDSDGDGIYELPTYRTIKELSANASSKNLPQYFIVESLNTTTNDWTMYGFGGSESDKNNFENNTSGTKASTQVIESTADTTKLFNFSDSTSNQSGYVTIYFNPADKTVWYTLSGGESNTVTITFVDGAGGWISDYGARIYAYDVDTKEHTEMTLVPDSDNKKWTVTLPTPAKNIAFYRCSGDWGTGTNTDTVTTYWNKWDYSATRNSNNTFKATANNQGSWSTSTN